MALQYCRSSAMEYPPVSVGPAAAQNSVARRTTADARRKARAAADCIRIR